MNLWRALFPKRDDALARSYSRADRLRWWYYGLGWADATKFIQRMLDEGRATWPNGTFRIIKTLLVAEPDVQREVKAFLAECQCEQERCANCGALRVPGQTHFCGNTVTNSGQGIRVQAEREAKEQKP